MENQTEFRKGPVGALMDEYERAWSDMKIILQNISQKQFKTIVDSKTEDPDCCSIQTVMNHVVRAGYGYANYIRKQWKQETTSNYEGPFASQEEAIEQMEIMLKYTLESLENLWNITDKEVMENVFTVSWGQQYDFEQILEHAIVHILRHRRQMERFLTKLKI